MVLDATYVRKYIGKLRFSSAQHCRSLRRFDVIEKSNLTKGHFYHYYQKSTVASNIPQLTDSRIWISSKTLPAVSTGSNTFPSTRRVFCMVSRTRMIKLGLEIESRHIFLAVWQYKEGIKKRKRQTTCKFSVHLTSIRLVVQSIICIGYKNGRPHKWRRINSIQMPDDHTN